MAEFQCDVRVPVGVTVCLVDGCKLMATLECRNCGTCACPEHRDADHAMWCGSVNRMPRSRPAPPRLLTCHHALAELKLLVNGIVTGSRLGDRGPAPAPTELGMPVQAPTQRTKRLIERGHGPRPVSAYSAMVRR